MDLRNTGFKHRPPTFEKFDDNQSSSVNHLGPVTTSVRLKRVNDDYSIQFSIPRTLIRVLLQK